MDRIIRITSLLTILVSAGFCVSLQAENLFEEQVYQSFVSDKKAFRVGDALTIIIIENAQAKSASDSNVKRDYKVSGSVDTSGGSEQGDLALGVGRTAGDVSQREGALKAALTVAVVGIDEAGNLQVTGSQKIALDLEEQLITVNGTVRPDDITADNTVLSSRLLDARIVYNGYDIADDGKRRNWFYRTLSSMGLI
jgi:flagellar L-ring protein precursor FlgH